MSKFKAIIYSFYLSDNNSSPSAKKFVAELIIILTLISVLTANLNSSSYIRYVATLGLINPKKIMNYIAQTDNQFKSTAIKGNILITFEGFDSSNSEHHYFAEKAYYRGNYLLFPKKAYVNEPKKIIKNGKDIIEGKFNPDKNWINKHQIKHVFAYQFHATGKITCNVSNL